MSAKKIRDNKYVLILFWLCWFLYFTVYIGRLNFSSAKAEMISLNLLTNTQAGSIDSFFFAFYAAGQLINGILGDKLSPKKMILIGIIGSGIANLSMGLFHNYFIMVILWAINGYSLSMIWPPIIKIFYDMMGSRSIVKALVNISSSNVAGTFVSYFLSAFMIKLFGWQASFFAPALLLSGMAIIWLIVFTKIEKHREEFGVVEETAEEKKNQIKDSDKKSESFVKLLFTSGIIILVIPTIIHGVLKDGVSSWVPTYISETFDASTFTSILATTALPVINLGGAYAAQFVNEKILKNEAMTVLTFFVITIFALIGLLFFGNLNIALSVFLLALTTTSMLAINVIFISLIPLSFGKYGKTSTMSGFLNSSAYLGSAISTVVIGVIVDKLGWNAAIFSWLVIAVIAAALCYIGRKAVSSKR